MEYTLAITLLSPVNFAEAALGRGLGVTAESSELRNQVENWRPSTEEVMPYEPAVVRDSMLIAGGQRWFAKGVE
jgi:hypothetical protein